MEETNMQQGNVPFNQDEIVVYCDESGAKGYSNKTETVPGELGVAAGILLRQSEVSSVQARFESVITRFRHQGGKLHITDLQADQQEELRQAVFGVLDEMKIPCLYEASYVQGIHAAHEKASDMLDAVKALSKIGYNPVRLEQPVSRIVFAC
jgi:hypothetical protein